MFKNKESLNSRMAKYLLLWVFVESLMVPSEALEWLSAHLHLRPLHNTLNCKCVIKPFIRINGVAFPPQEFRR